MGLRGIPRRRTLSEANLSPKNVIEYARHYSKPIQVLPRHGTTVSRSGTNVVGVYKELQPSDVADCNHITQICQRCAPSWFNDCFVLSFKHGGTTGYGKGCRCDPCMDAASKATKKYRKGDTDVES